MSDVETFHAVVSGVYAEDLGDQLTAAAGIGATVLSVRDVADFDEEGGFLLLNGALLEYASCDDDTSTITLTVALTVAALTDDRVDLWDEANSQKATIYKAVVDQIDGFDGVATAIIQESVAHSLARNMRDGTGESVTLTRDDDNELQLVQVHGRGFSLAAMQYLQGGMTTRTAEDQSGVDILGDDGAGVGSPGMYLYDVTGRLALLISDDAAGGVIKFWTGSPNEAAPGYIDPGLIGGGAGVPTLTLACGQEAAGAATAARHVMQANTPRGVHEFFGDASFDGSISAAGNITTGGGGGGVTVAGDVLQTYNAPSTTNPTNARIGTAGILNIVTSLSEHKLDQQELDVDDVRGILELAAKTWFDRADVEANGGTAGLRRVPGVVAEDVAEHVPDLALHDADGNLQGVAYDRGWVYLLPIVRDLSNQVTELTDQVRELTRANKEK